MKNKQLKIDVAAALQRVYDTKFVEDMIELCQGEVRVMLYIYTCEQDTVFPTDISRELNVTKQRVTSILSGLRKKGFVQMELAENDRRRMNIKITNAGVDFIYGKKAQAEEYFNLLADKLGEDNIAHVVNILNAVSDCLEEHENNGGSL